MPSPRPSDSAWHQHAAGRRAHTGGNDLNDSAGNGAGWRGALPDGPSPRQFASPALRLWIPVVLSALVQVPSAVFFAVRFPDRPGGLLAIILALIGPIVLIGSRRFPGPVVVVTALAASALLLIRPDIPTPNLALGFAIALGIVRGARIWVYSSVALVWVATIVFAAILGLDFNPVRVAVTTLALGVAMGIGEIVRTRRDRFAEYRRSAAARRMSAEQRERVRIARELHDVLAHSLSQINVQAGVGLHLIDSQPDKAREALANIKLSSKNALDEVRSVLGILRADGSDDAAHSGAGTDAGGSPDGPTTGARPDAPVDPDDPSRTPAPLAPEPDLAALPVLIESFRAQGMTVTFVTALEAESAAAAAIQLAIYRLCQEALTNVLRHSNGSGASVYLGMDRGDYLLTVTDDGTADAGGRELVQGGGLLGMRERAELLGGNLQVGFGDRGGFHLTARLPRRPDQRAPAGRER